MKNLAYEAFWQSCLGISPEEMASPDPILSLGGRYVEKREPDWIFFFQNFQTGKKVLSLSPSLYQKIIQTGAKVEVGEITEKSFASQRFLPEGALQFSDVDYVEDEFLPIPHAVDDKSTLLDLSQQQLIARFEAKLSEEDVETLDFRLGEDIEVTRKGASGELLGIARASRIPASEGLMDITVVVLPSARGQKIGLSLVSALVPFVHQQKRTLKYRAGSNNFASRAIADRLGLIPANCFLSWKCNQVVSR